MKRRSLFSVARGMCLSIFLGCGGPTSDPLPGRLNDTEYVRQRLAQGTTWKDGEELPIDKEELLLFAVSDGDAPVETVRVLLQSGADPDARESLLNKTPLFLAAYEGRVEIVQALIASGADVNAVDRFGNNALREAISAGHHDIVRLLLEAGAKPNQVNQDGESMADLASKYGTAEIQALFTANSVEVIRQH